MNTPSNILSKSFQMLKKNIVWDSIALLLLFFWIIIPFLALNFSQVDFFSSLFYLSISHFLLIMPILIIVRLFFFKLSEYINLFILMFIFFSVIKSLLIKYDTDMMHYVYDFILFEARPKKIFEITSLLITIFLMYKNIKVKNIAYILIAMNVIVLIENTGNFLQEKIGVETSDLVINNKTIELNNKNSTKPNIYIILPDTYPLFSNSKKYLGFENKEFGDFLRNNSFSVYNDMYSNAQTTTSSFYLFFGGTIDGLRKETGDNLIVKYTEQKYIKEFEKMKYKFATSYYNPNHSNGNYIKLSSKVAYEDNNYLFGFYDYIDIKYNMLVLNLLTIIDFDFFERLQGIENPLLKLTNEVLSFDNKNMISLIHGKGIARRINCDKNAYRNGVSGTIDIMKCINRDVVNSINLINKYDSNAIIVVMSDHGVSDDFTYSYRVEYPGNNITEDKIFSVLFAIKYPSQCSNYNDIEMKTLQSLMPNIIGCVKGIQPSEIDLENNEFSYFVNFNKNTFKTLMLNGIKININGD